LPFCHIKLRAARPELLGPEPRSLSGRIRWHRKKLGLTQQDLADQIGVSADTVRNWEQGRTRPDLRNLRALATVVRIPARFMAISSQEQDSFPVRLLATRRRLGLSQAELGARLDVCAETIWEWENGHHEPTATNRAAAEALIGETLGTAGPTGELIREIRERLGLSQRELGERLGVAGSSVSRWERGRRRPDHGIVERIQHLPD